VDTRQIDRSLWPLIIAHRGDSTSAPENTLAAFQSALNLGAHGIELDVRLSSDGVPIVIHDETLDRTTNGSGPVSSFTIKQLKLIKASNQVRHSLVYERLPTLEEAIRSIDTRAEIIIEMKGNDPMLANSVAETIAQCRAHQRCMVISFDHSMLKQFQKLDTSTLIGYLIDTRDACLMDRQCYIKSLENIILTLQPSFVLPHYSLLNDNLMDLAAQFAVTVGTWTVDKNSPITRMINLGVSRLITNNIELALSIRNKIKPPEKETRWT